MFHLRPLASLKIALIADDFTRQCLAPECRVKNITLWNYRAVFKLWRPDILFVESSWQGRWKHWQYQIPAYPEFPKRNNLRFAQVVSAAHDAGIPAVFWNREDGVHFDRFINSAQLFDRVMTVDESVIPRYRERLAPGAKVEVMMFAASPTLHFPAEAELVRRAAFVGSYGRHIHHGRRAWQDKMFEAASDLGLTIYDRNSKRRGEHYRYPNQPWIEVRSAIPYARTGDVYRHHAINLNVNTVDSSSTAFSRRLVEILACGGLALTNSTPAVTKFFADYCVTADDAERARAIFLRVKRDGLSAAQKEQARAGAAYVREHHTWRNRLAQIVELAL